LPIAGPPPHPDSAFGGGGGGSGTGGGSGGGGSGSGGGGGGASHSAQTLQAIRIVCTKPPALNALALLGGSPDCLTVAYVVACIGDLNMYNAYRSNANAMDKLSSTAPLAGVVARGNVMCELELGSLTTGEFMPQRTNTQRTTRRWPKRPQETKQQNTETKGRAGRRLSHSRQLLGEY
jgi:hypothetical protein